MDLFAPSSPELTAAFPWVQIKGKLGEGGQKFVYEAVTATEGTVALKIIKVSQDPERTIREIAAASRFSPPRFPQMYRHGVGRVAGDDVIYIVEEFVQGESLRRRLSGGSLGEDEAIRVGRELLAALVEVADQRLVHRDVKPENIMLGEDGRVVLLDFGIARHLLLNSLTQDAALFGPMTPGYCAPEQVRNEKRAISPRTDLFSWGIVMYEMLAGFNPFSVGCTTPAQALQKTLTLQPPRLNTSHPKLAQVIEWCLQKPAHRRPPHPAAVLAMI